jgi:hypothetical protein
MARKLGPFRIVCKVANPAADRETAASLNGKQWAIGRLRGEKNSRHRASFVDGRTAGTGLVPGERTNRDRVIAGAHEKRCQAGLAGESVPS